MKILLQNEIRKRVDLKTGKRKFSNKLTGYLYSSKPPQIDHKGMTKPKVDRVKESNVFGYDEMDFFDNLEDDFEHNYVHKDNYGKLKFDKSKRPYSDLIHQANQLQIDNVADEEEDDEAGFYEEDDDLLTTNKSRKVITDLSQLAEDSSDTPEAESEEDRFELLNQDFIKSSKTFRNKRNSILPAKKEQEADTLKIEGDGEKKKDDEVRLNFTPGCIHKLYNEELKKLQDETDSTVTAKESNNIQDLFEKLCKAKVVIQDEYVVFKTEEIPSGVQISKEDLLDSVKDLCGVAKEEPQDESKEPPQPPLENKPSEGQESGFDFSQLDNMGDMMDDDLCMDDDLDSELESIEEVPYEVKISCPLNQADPVSELSVSRRRTLHLLEEEDEENFNDVETVIEQKLVKSKSTKHQEPDFILKAEAKLNRISTVDMKEMMIELLHERMNYKEKLRIAKGAIVSRDNKIGQLKTQSKILPMSMSDSNIHLAFLFSSPLVRKRNSRLENIMQLDYLSEISDIVQVLHGLNFELKYKTDVATVSNLRSTITDLPIVLHFSGHGIQNTYENLGPEYHLSKEKGNILLLEDERGMSDYFFQKDLDELLELVHQANKPFEVVFVSSCYSQFAGEIFLKARAKHVICIRSGEQVADAASLRFSKVFYETLFVKNFNVCTSFRIAMEEVSRVINESEANKFLLLLQDDEGNRDSTNHTCYALSDFREGKISSINHQPIFDSVPANVEGFVGRQQEMYEIINLLDESRFVSILGPPGIGKTSISRNIGNYLKDRKKFIDGIIYVGLRG